VAKGRAILASVIEVMLSSTVSDLLPDRQAIIKALAGTGIVQSLGIEPVPGPSYGGSAYVTTEEMAQRCHLYMLILGRRYGFVAQNGKSASEIEYDAAYKDDPTKILVFRKRTGRVESRQSEFSRRVGEYHKGYFIREYEKPDQLGDLALVSFTQWLEERAALGRNLQYFDHFIRLAVQESPFPGVHPSYLVEEDHLELKYRILGKSYVIHFDKAKIYNDFWGSIALLKDRFREWRQDNYGRHP